jgi:hypothetical protein
VSGCGGSSPTGPTAAPAGVSVSVLQYRSDYTVRRMQLQVSNAGTVPVKVSAARLDSTAFRAEAAWLSRDPADETTIAPGTSTDLPAPLPPSDCADPASSAGFRTTARLDLRQADGSTTRTAALPVRDPYGSVATVHTQDCRREAALGIAELALVDPLRTATRHGRLVGLLDLRLTPSGRPGTLTVESIGPTTLLSPPEGASWPVGRTVSAGSGPQTVTLELRAARCDPHAIAEDKLGTVLPLTLRVDAGQSGVVTVPADPRLRIQIQRFVHDACTAG